MAFTTYDSLVEQITKWCNISEGDIDFKGEIPNFIALAEQQIFIDQSTLGNQFYQYQKFTIGTDIVPLPLNYNWGRTLTFSVFYNLENPEGIAAPNTIIERITLERGLQYITETTTGFPKYYTDFGFGQVKVFPTPDEQYPYLFGYYGRITPLTQQNQTNWNSLNNFDALFYCCLAKAYLYLKNSEQSSINDALYKERLKAMLDYDRNRLADRNINATTFNDSI